MVKKKATIWSKNFIILFLINIVAMTGFQMLNPNMAEYVSSLGADTGILGAVTAVLSFAALVARPFSGKAADRLDNKKLIILSIAGTALTLLSYSLAPTVSLILVVRFIHGVFFGLNSTLAMTMASRSLPEERMGAGMGVFGLGTVLASTVGPTLGIYIAELLGFKWLFYFAAICAAIANVFAFFLNKQPKTEYKSTGGKGAFLKTFFAPEALSPSTIGLLNASAYGSINTFLLLHAKQRGIADIGLYFTVNALTLLVCRPIIAKFIDKVPMKYIIYPCSFCMIGSMILISVAQSLPVFLLAAVLFGLGNGGSQPALQTLCLKCVGNERRGAASGTYYMGLDVGNTIGPMMCGMIAGSFGYGSAFLAMIIPILLGMGVMFITDRKQKRMC